MSQIAASKKKKRHSKLFVFDSDSTLKLDYCKDWTFAALFIKCVVPNQQLPGKVKYFHG